MSHRTTLSDLIAAIAKNMTTAELAKAVVNIQIQQMIHDTRMAKGWAQKDLADKMGVKQSLGFPLGKRGLQLYHRHFD